MHLRRFCKIISIAAVMALSGAHAHSQSPIDSIEAIDMAEIEHFAGLAQSGTDPRVTASLREQFTESGPQHRTLPAILVSIEGEPAFVYVKERWGSKDSGFRDVIPFVMRCRGSAVVDLSYHLFGSRPLYQPEEEAAFLEVAGQVKEFGRSVPAVLRLRPYDVDARYDMPVAFAFEYDNRSTVDADGKVSHINVQLVGAARADDPFFVNLRATGNLAGQLMINGQYKSFVTGVGLETFRASAGPLLEHCRTGSANPMDRDLDPLPDGAATPATVQTPATLDLSFISRSREPYLRRIYLGFPAPTDLPLHMRLTTPLAFYAAYSAACGQNSEIPLDFVHTGIFGRDMVIGVPPEDFASLYATGLIYGPVLQKIYEERASNDYSLRDVMNIHRGDMEEWARDWEAILARHGCVGEISDQLRRNVRAELPFLEYQRGSGRVLVDFGVRQIPVTLSTPIDVEVARQVGRAEAQPGNDAIFTSSYPGMILRAIAVGNFAQVEEINEELREAVSNPFGGDADNLMSKFIRSVMELDSRVSRESGILAAYAIGRTHHLGACGDPITTYTQDAVYWTEYVNGFGQHVSSSPESRRTTTAEVPSKFDAIVRRSNSIDTSWFLDREMAQIVSRMSCDSAARRQLEDNMIAYFNDRAPVHIGAIPER